MDVFNVISLAGGLALFLYGMSVLGSGLEKISSGRMEKILEKLTSNIFKSVALGAVVTAAVQSSSATTVIVVGLVNAGILKLGSAVGVIMGANIGTTITGQLLRLGDLENNPNVGLALKFLKPTTLAPMIAIIGILMFMIARRSKVKVVGEILLGFGILFNGMFAMEAAVSGLKDVPAFGQVFATLSNPILGVLAGAIVTALIQSSSASIGILQALSSTGAITCASAFPIIMGQNIGTCITPIMSSIGANKNAKRAAMVHLYFNLIGTAVFLGAVYAIQYIHIPAWWVFPEWNGFSFWHEPINRGGIANFHTLFNIIVTLGFIPFWRILEKLATWTIRNTKHKDDDIVIGDDTTTLDERFFISPSLAIQQSHKTVLQMGKLALHNFREMRSLYNDKYDVKAVERIKEYESTIDRLEDKLNNYLLQVSELELTDSESRSVTAFLHLLSEFERIGDYTINIVESAEEMYDKQISFSKSALKEFNTMCDAIDEIISIALLASETYNLDDVVKIEPLEEVVDQIVDKLKMTHVQRFKTGQCAIEAGVIFLDILTNLERISDHCSNIGVYLIIKESKRETLNRHEYIESLHTGQSEKYEEIINFYSKKYVV